MHCCGFYEDNNSIENTGHADDCKDDIFISSNEKYGCGGHLFNNLSHLIVLFNSSEMRKETVYLNVLLLSIVTKNNHIFDEIKWYIHNDWRIINCD